MKSALGIIPNKELLDVEDYYKDLEENERHSKYILIFSNQHNLGIALEASFGHLVLCVDNDNNIIDSKEYGYRGNVFKSLYYYVENSVDFSLNERGR